eukprot:TRINITY_DN10428_c0_g1_i1.p1 TRINITY_DN10428_c0_g1~~TRINITY_DN10428_c0_g1_i1.p1  ORF type:complete len:182 (-),score=23.66 TRINITY_DN10428_c0_g1_i1:19-564(-)
MGNVEAQLTPTEIEEMKMMSNFSEKELRRLHRRFKKLDTDGSGTLTIDEFMSIPELAVNPLLVRVIQIFDENKDNQVQFTEFIKALSVFSENGNKEQKLKFAFQVYDIDADGFISNGELFQVLKMMVGNNLTEVQLQQIVDKTILEADEDKDGKISYEEFKKMISNVDEIETKMTLSFGDS